MLNLLKLCVCRRHDRLDNSVINLSYMKHATLFDRNKNINEMHEDQNAFSIRCCIFSIEENEQLPDLTINYMFNNNNYTNINEIYNDYKFLILVTSSDMDNYACVYDTPIWFYAPRCNNEGTAAIEVVELYSPDMLKLKNVGTPNVMNFLSFSMRERTMSYSTGAYIY